MSNKKNNTKKSGQAFKRRKTPGELHDLFLQWLMLLLSDDRSRAEIRAMIEQHEMPVIDGATGNSARS
jgi:hypothetical protein